MFSKAEARYALRCILVGAAAAVTALSTDGWEAWPKAILSGFVALFAYAGVGAAVPQVEPFVGAKLQPPPEPPEGDA